MPTTGTNEGDRLLGDRIVMQARRLSDGKLLRGTSARKATQIVGRQNVVCVIEVPLKNLSKGQQSR